MSRKTQLSSLNLFDLIEREEVKETAQACSHTKEEKTDTRWPGYPHWDIRMTWTCLICGRIRGRAHG